MTDPPQPPEGPSEGRAIPARLMHDLRTPLHQILGYSEMLMEDAQAQGQAELAADLQKTHAAGRQLLSLIDDNFYAEGSSENRAATVAPPNEIQIPTSLAPAAEASHHDRPAEPVRGFVLVVDDIADNRDVLSRRLQLQGHAAATAENGREALEKLRSETFDLVLLDVMMPEIDGYEVLQQLKADKALRHIPVIMISALSELDSTVRCIELGAEDYLTKPFNPTLLKARIGACLEKKRSRDREQELAADLHSRNKEMATWRKAQEADLAVARSTQQAIVSAALPQLDGWQVETVYTPLIQVGGDVYGWRDLSDGRCLFWLADATGHGVAAALFTTLVALLFNHASTGCSTAHEILTRVNAEFHSVLRGRSFMSACCVVIESDGRLSFAGAGQPSLLVRRRDKVIEALPSLSSLIGIDPTAKIGETVTTLAPGDVALFYSDGLYSLKSNSHERFTSNSVIEILARIGDTAEVLPQLLAQLARQSDGRGFDDDLAAIALRRG